MIQLNSLHQYRVKIPTILSWNCGYLLFSYITRQQLFPSEFRCNIWANPREEDLEWHTCIRVACSRLSDSGEDAKVKGTRKGHWEGEGGIWARTRACGSRALIPLPFQTPATQARHGAEKRKGLSFVPFIIFVLALSQFSGPDYLGAWNRLVLDELCDGNREIPRVIYQKNLRQFWNITSGIYAKYHVQIMLLFVYTTTHKRFVIFTCRYFKLSWNTTTLSQSNCRNFSCSGINEEITCKRQNRSLRTGSLFGERVKKSRGERRVTVRACRQTFGTVVPRHPLCIRSW